MFAHGIDLVDIRAGRDQRFGKVGQFRQRTAGWHISQ
jgi:hypothetical protein